MTSWPPNYLVVGAWSLLVCGTLAAAALLVWCGMVPARLGVLRVLSGALAVAAAVTVMYTGLLLSDMPSVPLWNTPWLVAVFALSGLSCGLALVLLSALGGGTHADALSAPGAPAVAVRALAPPFVLTAALCVLVGGAILRYLVVVAGALPVVISPM